MKIVAFVPNDGEEILFGLLTDNDRFNVIGDPYLDGEIEETGRSYLRSDVVLVNPAFPSKALCIGLNYADHAREFGLPVPKSPVVFMKPSSALAGPDDYIIKPPQCTQLDQEAELCVVIGKECRNVEESEAGDYILGYCCANDVTARDLQPKDGQWTIAKGFDTFLPLGPYISDEVDPSDLSIECRINGRTVQKSSTSNLIFSVPRLVSYLSKCMTLSPGDVILTGTPSGTTHMNVGDVVEVEIEGLGTLRNTVDSL